MTTQTSSAITIDLSDQTGLATTGGGAAYVAGWINADPVSPFQFQPLQSDGTFGTAPTVQPFVVQSTMAWQDTGLSVTPAAVPVTITYVGGGWTADPATNGGVLYDAGGCPGLNVPKDRTAFPMTLVPMGGLVGKIGTDGTPFFIGRGPFLMPSAFPNGELYLCINDDLTGVYGAGLTDNSGSISVAIFAQGLAYNTVASMSAITLATATNGNERMIFTVSPSKPVPLPLYAASPPPASPPPSAPTGAIPAAAVMQYPPAPYTNQPNPPPPGPFDAFEFGYNAAADVTAVNGFLVNLSFATGGTSFGVDPSVSRATIGTAFNAFIANEGTQAAPYGKLLLATGVIGSTTYAPPLVNSEFFALADPSDMLIAEQNLGTASSDALASYWDTTLASFFAVNSYLSIDLSGNGSNVYTGQCTAQTLNSVSTNAYTLSNGTNSYTFYQPPAGIDSALYVFQQQFSAYQSGGSGGDAGLLQMNIWEALCRGVAVAGVSATTPTSGYSTTAWNAYANWYAANSVCDYYAKFLHYATTSGTDSRIVGNGSPMFYGAAAYGFSADEDPNGSYGGGNVPSKTTSNVTAPATISIVVGPW